MPIKKTIQDIKVPERAPARTPVEPVVSQRRKPSLRTRTVVAPP